MTRIFGILNETHCMLNIVDTMHKAGRPPARRAVSRGSIFVSGAQTRVHLYHSGASSFFVLPTRGEWDL